MLWAPSLKGRPFSLNPSQDGHVVKRIIEGINAAILLCMFTITVVTVIFRVFLKIPASWSEDLAQYSFIFLVFIGSIALMKDESHISITALPDRMSPKIQKIMRIAVRILVLPFMYYFITGAWRNIMNNWEVSLSTVKWLKIGYMYSVVFASGCLMTYYILINLYKDLFNKRTAEGAGKEGDPA